MQKKSVTIAVAIAIIALAGTILAGCAERQKKANGIVIAVSILPQKYFLERVGGNRVTALVLVGPGQNPHSYEPTPRQMAALAASRAWIKSGTDFEISLEPKIRKQYPALSIVDGTAGVFFRELEKHSHADEQGENGESAQTSEIDGNSNDENSLGLELNIDRHSWLGRVPAKIMAGWVRDTLISIDPAGEALYRANCESLVADIDAEFDSLKTRLAPLEGTKVFVFHPSFGYFLDEFGITQEAVEIGGKEPTARALAALIEEAKRDKPSAIFVQAQFSVNAAKKIADSVGAEVISLDPLAPDWLANIKSMGSVLEKVSRTAQQKGGDTAK
jgi:zinc transport system substrate-binding protein